MLGNHEVDEVRRCHHLVVPARQRQTEHCCDVLRIAGSGESKHPAILSRPLRVERVAGFASEGHGDETITVVVGFRCHQRERVNGLAALQGTDGVDEVEEANRGLQGS